MPARFRAGAMGGMLALACLLACPPARASERLYWNWATLSGDSVVNSGIARADPETGVGQYPGPGSAPVEHPLGVVLDSTTGTLYWVNFGNNRNYCVGPLAGGQTISFAGAIGAGTLNTAGATVSGPDGLSIDPVGRRLYWANDNGNSISSANLDGSGGRDLAITGATLKCPAGVAVDPVARRVYWSNYHGDAISYANLDGSGARDLTIHGVAVSQPWGLAIDSLHGKIYWANYGTNTIAYANLDGSDGAVLNTTGADVNGPWGLSIDPAEGKVYWANNLGASLAWAWSDGSGAGNVGVSGVTTDHPKQPMLVESPSSVEAPQISGGSVVGSRLECSTGDWGADLPESFLFRAPSSFTYSWTRDGNTLGSSANSIVASSTGDYSCQVTATNLVGSAAQSSPPFPVGPVASLSIASLRLSRSGVLTISAQLGGGPGRVAAFAALRRGRRAVLYGTAAASGSGTVGLTMIPSRRAVRLLLAGRRARLSVWLAFASVDGSVAQASRSVWVRGPARRR